MAWIRHSSFVFELWQNNLTIGMRCPLCLNKMLAHTKVKWFKEHFWLLCAKLTPFTTAVCGSHFLKCCTVSKVSVKENSQIPEEHQLHGSMLNILAFSVTSLWIRANRVKKRYKSFRASGPSPEEDPSWHRCRSPAPACSLTQLAGNLQHHSSPLSISWVIYLKSVYGGREMPKQWE